ncbi:hypothetical protein HYP93_gp05 [Stenotrophomonas phage Pokken]|uniref:Uncharacterized protein n=1 Tax=Stenotrophomonas phage Pokken TaxID=2596674 RepID=A0A5B9N566_9CAUD|nr:hypothetical protein HYP93_gp05 [Stenotrophomonas phage Pokken]QEG09228.1 hypothetical protein CPT_Pokken_005 [Stenotrophomonas phage Pokken]
MLRKFLCLLGFHRFAGLTPHGFYCDCGHKTHYKD